ncbi:MAG: hypothetical protein MK136_17850, partial [Pirellulaceae bacterium]|nr:hypothetical protein [Pirellulaceae bacterium]
AQELYAGDHWQIARSLPHVAKSAGWDTRLWICSPGYGLIKSTSLIAPYSATFSMTHPDSVSKPSRTERVEYARRWWDRISKWGGPDPGAPRTIAQLAADDPRSSLVVAASKSIVAVIENDLRQASEQLRSGQELIIVSGGTKAKGHFADHLLTFDARLQPLLGGARMSLNVRILRRLLSKAWATDGIRNAWNRTLSQLLSGAPKLQKFDRVSLTDGEVRSFILEGLHQDQKVSRTRLLRRLRDSGHRCEEKRFKALFERLIAEIDLLFPG